jgi:hypothetical protein
LVPGLVTILGVFAIPTDSGKSQNAFGDPCRKLESFRARTRDSDEKPSLPVYKTCWRRHKHRSRKGGRVVEGARLESVYTGNRIAGSNPAPSASKMILAPDNAALFWLGDVLTLTFAPTVAAICHEQARTMAG